MSTETDRSSQPFVLKIVHLGTDDWSRPMIRSEKGTVLVDIECGSSTANRNGIPGDWHTVTDEGEPVARIAERVVLQFA